MGSTTCTQLPPFGEHRAHDGETAARRDSVRVVRHFAWLEVGSGKAALSRPAHQPSLGGNAITRRERAGHIPLGKITLGVDDVSRWAALGRIAERK